MNNERKKTQFTTPSYYATIICKDPNSNPQDGVSLHRQRSNFVWSHIVFFCSRDHSTCSRLLAEVRVLHSLGWGTDKWGTESETMHYLTVLEWSKARSRTCVQIDQLLCARLCSFLWGKVHTLTHVYRDRARCRDIFPWDHRCRLEIYRFNRDWSIYNDNICMNEITPVSRLVLTWLAYKAVMLTACSAVSCHFWSCSAVSCHLWSCWWGFSFSKVTLPIYTKLWGCLPSQCQVQKSYSLVELTDWN